MSSTALAALRDAFAHCHTMDAPLSERLDAYSKAVRTHIPDYADAVDRLAERLTYNNAGATAPQSGDPMPPFVLPDESGRLVSSASLLTRGPVAITFHRGHWCPWCRISVMALAQVQDEIARTGGQVVAIVPERQKFAAELKARTKSPFAVLTDMDNGYALSLNLAIWVGQDLERLLASYGLALPDYQGNPSWMLPIPATFVVAPDGYVKARFIDPDFRRRMAVQDLLEALSAAR
ncbi:MAG TPA: peroxiredoxin-like family protein [Xanthobacteraceae bacterium]|jgi:peroxiredoxin|nr:peroxiredoxin-like family protein [Xanthobacteraceae bacterium]